MRDKYSCSSLDKYLLFVKQKSCGWWDFEKVEVFRQQFMVGFGRGVWVYRVVRSMLGKGFLDQGCRAWLCRYVRVLVEDLNDGRMFMLG